MSAYHPLPFIKTVVLFLILFVDLGIGSYLPKKYYEERMRTKARNNKFSRRNKEKPDRNESIIDFADWPRLPFSSFQKFFSITVL